MNELELKVLEIKSKLLKDVLEDAEICDRGMINEAELGRRVLKTYETYMTARHWGAFNPWNGKCIEEGIEENIPINWDLSFDTGVRE